LELFEPFSERLQINWRWKNYQSVSSTDHGWLGNVKDYDLGSVVSRQRTCHAEGVVRILREIGGVKDRFDVQHVLLLSSVSEQPPSAATSSPRSNVHAGAQLGEAGVGKW
jgi:hypothetical protein